DLIMTAQKRMRGKADGVSGTRSGDSRKIVFDSLCRRGRVALALSPSRCLPPGVPWPLSARVTGDAGDKYNRTTSYRGGGKRPRWGEQAVYLHWSCGSPTVAGSAPGPDNRDMDVLRGPCS